MKKTTRLAAACFQAALCVSTWADGGGALTIRFTGLDNDKGTVRLALFDSEASYKADDAEKSMLRGAEAPIQDGTSEIVLTRLPPGTYAFKVFHDENGNGKLDTNFIGVPREQYAFSNNARGRMGIPPFAKSSFVFDSDKTMEITF